MPTNYRTRCPQGAQWNGRQSSPSTPANTQVNSYITHKHVWYTAKMLEKCLLQHYVMAECKPTRLNLSQIMIWPLLDSDIMREWNISLEMY